MTITLERGAHASPEDGVCLLEAVAFVAGERFTDRPQCVSPILAAYGRGLNDLLPNKQRQRLVPLIPKLIGTVDDEADQRDGLRCAHWLVTHWLPAWLDLVPELAGHAATLRTIPAPESWVDLEDWTCLLTRLVRRGAERPTIGAGWLCDPSDAKTFTCNPAAAVLAEASPYFAGTVRGTVRTIADYAVQAAAHPAHLRPTSEQLQQNSIDLFVELVEGRSR